MKAIPISRPENAIMNNKGTSPKNKYIKPLLIML